MNGPTLVSLSQRPCGYCRNTSSKWGREKYNKSQCKWKMHATHAAAYKGHTDVLVKLKEYGCDLNVTTEPSKYTPLHFAVQQGHVKVSEWLVVNGVNPHACDINGVTPVQLATMKGHTNLASFMANQPTEKASVSARTTNLECVVCMEDP